MASEGVIGRAQATQGLENKGPLPKPVREDGKLCPPVELAVSCLQL